MLLTAPLWRRSLLSALCLGLAAYGHAATNIYMSITSAKQGPFKGEGKAPRAGEWVPILSISEMPAAAGRDVATGQASGKRQHEPIKIVKEMGTSSPQLQRALATGEPLKEVVFEFYRSNGNEKDELYETIRLTDAIITSIQNRGAGKGDERPKEEISFAYMKIETIYAPQKHTPTALQPAPAVKPAPPVPR